ncbi:MAG TPA: transporter [Acidobacteriaceae bacterium]|nr:transporter [Acidobacteriaceae bacterium]
MPPLVCKTHGTRKPSGALRLFTRSALSSALLMLALVTLFTPHAHAQQSPTLPAVNLGDTSFLDAIAFPGWLVELIGQGVHDNKTLNNAGQVVPQITDINSGALLLHIAWLAHHPRILGAWYGTEIVLTGAYVDTGGHGVGQGLGDFTFAPIILQWPKHTVFGMPIYQRVTFDIDAPIGRYSPESTVNIGNNAWDIHPYYAVTLFPAKRIETSWRIHYLWDATNHAPPLSENAKTSQAGQAIHFNATASYEIIKNVYVGANGYYLKQITDARINDTPVPNACEQIGGIGPGAVVNRGQWFFYVNAYHEVGAENLPEGNKLVLRVEKVF